MPLEFIQAKSYSQKTVGRLFTEFVLLPAVMVCVALLALRVSYLTFHALAESFSILIATMAMVVATVSLGFTRNHFSVHIAIAVGWCGVLDALHTFAYQGMGLLPFADANMATQFWVAARGMQAIALLISPIWLRHPVTPLRLHAAFGGCTLILTALVLSGYFPDAYVAEQGLTRFKLYAEYLIISMLMLAAWLLWRNRQLMSTHLLVCLLLAVFSMVLSELCFTLYLGVYSFANMLGHIFKILAYWFVYLALVHNALREPFDLLTRAASTYDAIPDPVLVTDTQGRILQVNRAATRFAGRSSKSLVGHSSHYVFHDPLVRVSECPICCQLAQKKHVFGVTLVHGHRVLDYSLAPFNGNDPVFVQVIRDITLKHQLEQDREYLLSDLELHLDELKASEQRFHELFDASPVPLQIVSLDSLKLRAVNRAYVSWLGYTLEQIENMESLFGSLFEDPIERSRQWHSWLDDIASAKQGKQTTSPELLLRAADGRHRMARCQLTVVRNDLMMAWLDFTDIRQSENSLRESERRFRNMIEQSVTGIFVCRDERFVYVNPKFCELSGWTAQEFLTQELRLFGHFDHKNNLLFSSCPPCLNEPSCCGGSSGEVNCIVPLHCKDGRLLEMDLRSSDITWDDGLPATIVLAQDITERKKAEQQIAHYVHQLERSMKGTLHAVSHMVEMRDPYTAGHERKVGLIARAIGAEMGWDDERCDTLEMAGLVHDVGKIAIPAEILTKPSRLSHLEMELVRGHAQAGYEILKDVPFPVPIADIIHQHHERMDGSGYPQRLVGDAILPEARVLAVADVIESMAAHRPYRAALGIGVALAEIEQGQGTLYDLSVAQAAIRLIRDKGYQLPD